MQHDRCVRERTPGDGRERVVLNHHRRVDQFDAYVVLLAHEQQPVSENAVLQRPARKAGLFGTARPRERLLHRPRFHQLEEIAGGHTAVRQKHSERARHRKKSCVDHWERREIVIQLSGSDRFLHRGRKLLAGPGLPWGRCCRRP
eukprot:3308333-Prymnesium_polylepis.1